MRKLFIFLIFINFNLNADVTFSKLIEAEIKLEKKLMQADIDALGGIQKSWRNTIARVSELQNMLMASLREGGASGQIMENLVQQISSELALASSYAEQMKILNERIFSRQKRIEILEMEKAESKAKEEEEDPLSGEWEVNIFPQELKGKFILKLTGTLVSGTYELTGGWKGSLKGTLVGNRIRLERIDAEQGFMAVYYGKVDVEKFFISGTWESTLFTTGGPMTGNWTAKKIREQ